MVRRESIRFCGVFVCGLGCGVCCGVCHEQVAGLEESRATTRRAATRPIGAAGTWCGGTAHNLFRKKRAPQGSTPWRTGVEAKAVYRVLSSLSAHGT